MGIGLDEFSKVSHFFWLYLEVSSALLFIPLFSLAIQYDLDSIAGVRSITQELPPNTSLMSNNEQ
jgi:hypothetical protein